MFLRGAIFAVFFPFLHGCSSEDAPEVNQSTDHEYMPLTLGIYQIYDVSETIYVNGPEGESRRYQLKMEVIDSVEGVNGTYTYVISRQTRLEGEPSWTNLDTWSASFEGQEAVVQEGNISYVKLMTPVSLELFWNGNRYNTKGEENYTITSLDQPMTLSEEVFDDVVEITHNDFLDINTRKDIRKEVYARGVGLVKRSEEVIEYCSDADLCEIGSQIILQGRIVEQVIVEYGKN